MATKVLLDTSILIKLRGRKFGAQLAAWLTTHLPEANFYVSDVSRYEFLRTSKGRAELDRGVVFLRDWGTIECNRDVMRAATHYYNVLRNERKSRNGSTALTMNQFGDADILIGATAIRHGLLLCTTDGNDFPRPFFLEQKQGDIGNGERLFLLEPDSAVFDQRLTALYGQQE